MLNLVSLIITGLFKNISLSRLKSTYLLESGLYPGGQVFGSFGSKPEGQVPGLLGSKFDLPPLGLFSSKLDEELPGLFIGSYDGSLDPSIGFFLGSDIFWNSNTIWLCRLAFSGVMIAVKVLNLLYCLVWIFNSYKLDILTFILISIWV
ncbi:hypothetical protein HYE18_00925 [Mycoplasmopsis bovis]|nr:hypothetical protein [Mycoplasmopsis bovis]QQH25004.1 hypothetical protein HYE18_00925 [Mycoplasmopsis bovis]